MDLPVCRADFSPFASKIIDGVSVLPFLPQTLHLTDNTRDENETTNYCISHFPLLKMPCGKCRKWHFWAPKFEKFPGGACPPDPPSFQYLRKCNLSFRAYNFKTSRYAPVYFMSNCCGPQSKFKRGRKTVVACSRPHIRLALELLFCKEKNNFPLRYYFDVLWLMNVLFPQALVTLIMMKCLFLLQCTNVASKSIKTFWRLFRSFRCRL